MPAHKSVFLREFLRSPAKTGAVAPSSRRLAQVVCAPVPERGDPVVVELGPGTGSFTREIARRLAGRGAQIAVEVNPALAQVLAGAFPELDLVRGDAADLPKFLSERGIDRADVVVSGLPWAVFPDALQRSIIRAVSAALAPGGAFTTFAYVHALWMPPARRFRRLLESEFDEVVASRTIWPNLPPALVYTARRPRP
ncbi:methyltransferase domain-containing protein [Sphaerisporangium sp. NPDC051011]|uniref:class I SAM-dependent methyltransferase n=1 Tax=Sphaerisporangium sp. NPDC051011 TaxID=3155792 RepID=UPI0033DC0FC1